MKQSKNELKSTTAQNGFDLFRLSKSKQSVDLAPNTIRAYAKDGLPIYKMGKAVFISRAQLAQHIITRGA